MRFASATTKTMRGFLSQADGSTMSLLEGPCVPHSITPMIRSLRMSRWLKTLSGLTPYEYICKIWTSEPDRFILVLQLHLVSISAVSICGVGLMSSSPKRPGKDEFGWRRTVEDKACDQSQDFGCREAYGRGVDLGANKNHAAPRWDSGLVLFAFPKA